MAFRSRIDAVGSGDFDRLQGRAWSLDFFLLPFFFVLTLLPCAAACDDSDKQSDIVYMLPYIY